MPENVKNEAASSHAGKEKKSGTSGKKRPDDTREMPFLDHLEELRWRILKSLTAVFVCMIAALVFSEKLLYLLTLPNNRLAEPSKLIFLKPTGMLLVRMEIALVAGLIIASPIIFTQFWRFVAPGLLQKERHFVKYAIFYSVICFAGGCLFAYGIMIPSILPFLYQMGTDTIQATININDYISFILRLILVAGMIFEMPVISFFLARIGILTPDFMKKYRRYGIVLVFVVSAIITPPDPVSQLLMALPLLFLYQISIWVSAMGQRKKKESDASDE